MLHNADTGINYNCNKHTLTAQYILTKPSVEQEQRPDPLIISLVRCDKHMLSFFVAVYYINCMSGLI